jgi:hypothetical protein
MFENVKMLGAAVCVCVGVVPLLPLAPPLHPHNNNPANTIAVPIALPERILGLQWIPAGKYAAHQEPTIRPPRESPRQTAA